MEVSTSDNICGDDVKVSGMMHLLISGHFETKDHLYQTIEHVYRNFTLLYKVPYALIVDWESKLPEENECVNLKSTMGFVITFCRYALRRILEEDGITINRSLAYLLAEIELHILNFVEYCTDQITINRNLADFLAEIELQILNFDKYCTYQNNSGQVLFSEIEGLMERIYKAYREPLPIYYYHLTINYDLILEFLDQCLHDLNYLDGFDIDIHTSINYFIVLRNYVELLNRDLIKGDNWESLLIAVEKLASEITHYIFIGGINEYKSWEHYDERFYDFQSVFHSKLLQALVLQSDGYRSNAPLMSDELVIGYVNCVQENLLKLLNNNTSHLTVTLKNQLRIVNDGLSVMQLLITDPLKHNSEQEKPSNIRLEFQALARNAGSIVCSCFDNPEIEEISLCLLDLIKKINVIKEEIINNIYCTVLQITQQESPKKDQLSSLILLLQSVKEFMILTWKDHENLVRLIFYLIHNTITGVSHIGDDEFFRNILQLDVALTNHEELHAVLVSAQVVAFNMACSSLMKRYGTLCWWELYFETEGSVDLKNRVRILKAIVLSSTTPLTDELLIAYVGCIGRNITELLKDDYVYSLIHQFKGLRKGLSYLANLLISYRDEEQGKLSHIKVRVQDLMRSIGSLVCSCFSNRLRTYTIRNQSSSELSNLVEKMNLTIVEIQELVYLVDINKIGHESPKTNPVGSLNLLLENWKGLMQCEADLINTWSGQLQMIYENLVLFKSFMITNTTTADDESKQLCSSIMDAGYLAEYLLCTIVSGTCPIKCTSLWISEFTEHVELIKSAVREANEKKSHVKRICAPKRDRSQDFAQALAVPTSIDVVVGFEVEMQLIMNKLTGHIKQLDVISIVGMPGLGKTTLARKAYENPCNKNYFDVRAWCCVSQDYNEKELFLTILGSISQLTSQTRGKDESELSELVHKQLKGRRYLIVLDDIWDINVFIALKRYFPNDNNGSRIMMTTRSKVIGSQAQVQHHCDLIEPRRLTVAESWDLLQRKIYNKEDCPPNLCEIGKEIAEKCKGLPLAIVVVGGVLAKSSQTGDFWEQVKENLSLYLAGDSQSQFMAALELSYEFLPDCLKPMFLYVGAFPEDKEIPTNKLMWLWIAEGFLQNTGSMSLESQAEKSLMDLIDRSLIMVAKRSSDGRVKACIVHDLLRDMCLEKAKEEKFMRQVRVHNELPDHVMYQRRLSIILTEHTNQGQFPCKYLPNFSITPPIYSLLFSHMHSCYSLCEDRDLAPVIVSLKLLKVFDAEPEIIGITQDVLDKYLIKLVHLRYASFCTPYNCENIPSSISQLQSLETLIIKVRGYINWINVPETIWEMRKLRHLHINNRPGKFSVTSENSFILENLQTLSGFCIDAGEEEKIFRKLPALKRLRYDYVNDGDETQRFQFPDFESLGKLESLTFQLFSGTLKLRRQLKFPLTLKKLSMDGLKLEWSQISMLKTLPNLVVLKLKCYAVADEVWEMGDDDEFSNLKILMLSGLTIKRWSVSSENFPSLEKLVVENCPRLVEISSELVEIYTLQKIQVTFCSLSLEKQVKDIQKEQEELGNASLEFYFHHNLEY